MGVHLNAVFGGRWCFILILALSGNLTQTVPRGPRRRSRTVSYLSAVAEVLSAAEVSYP
jgi:hypothetical protein